MSRQSTHRKRVSETFSRRRRIRQELLEPRYLLALDVAFHDGVLDIRATDNDDIIVSSGGGG